jgi:uncharacterized membrane protein YhaH (DUF805 family)
MPQPAESADRGLSWLAYADAFDKHSGLEGVMDWYLMVWRKYAEFDGRSRRTEYWMFALFNFLAMLLLGGVGVTGITISENYGGFLFIPLGIYVLAAIIPNLAVAVRRLHDSGKSGWLLLLFFVLGLIPFVGFIASIVQIVIMCQDSTPGTNEYGPNPKFPDQDGTFPVSSGLTSLGLGAQPQPFTVQGNFGFCKACGAKLTGPSTVCLVCGAQL